MYSNAVIIEIAKDEEREERNNCHYCFDVVTENNNKKRLIMSLVCFFSFMGGVMYVFLDHMINHATI